MNAISPSLFYMLAGLIYTTVTLWTSWRYSMVFGVGDIVIQALVQRDTRSFQRSLMLPFVQRTYAWANILWNLPFQILKIDPLYVDGFRYVLTGVVASFAVGHIAAQLTSSPFASVVAIALLLGSNFAYIGWWLRPRFLIVATHGLMGLAIGGVIIAYALSEGVSPCTWLIVGLLVSYHPVHGMIISGFLAVLCITGIVMSVGVSFEISATAWIAGVLPLFLLTLWKRIRSHNSPLTEPIDYLLWWQLLKTRTGNVFALAALDQRSGGGGWRTLGTPPVVLFLAGLLALYGSAAANGGGPILFLTPVTSPDQISRVILAGQVIWLLSLGSFVSQLILVDLLRLRFAVPIAPARSTAYPTFFLVCCWVLLASLIIQRAEIPGAIVVMLCAIGLIWPPDRDHSWLVLLSFVPLLGWLSIPGDLGIVLNAGIVVVMLGMAPAVLNRLRHRGQAPTSGFKRFLINMSITFKLGTSDFISIALLSLASVITLFWGQARHMSTSTLATGWGMPVVAGFVLLLSLVIRIIRRGWPFDIKLAESWKNVQLWAKESSAPTDFFLTPPHLTGFETFSHRAKMFDRLEGSFCIYVPSMTSEVARRCATLGVDIWQVPTLELVPNLSAAYRALTGSDLLRLQRDIGIQYAVVEKEFFRPEQWLLADIVYQNEHFVVVRPSSLGTPNGTG